MFLKIRRLPQPEGNMTPMIDVVFQLLIYFMCTFSFLAVELDLEASFAPGVSSSTEREKKDLEPIRIYVCSADRFNCNQAVCSSAEALYTKLAALRAHADVQVIVDGDPNVPFGPVVTAMNAAIRARFSKVAIAGGRRA